MAETLRQRYGAARVKVVINRFDKDVGDRPRRTSSGRSAAPSKHLIPSDYRVGARGAERRPPARARQDSRLGQGASRDFAQDLAGVAKEGTAERPSGVLGRLAWRRA